MTTLTSLVSMIEADVPALNGCPTTAQYSQAVRDAVADLGRRAPMTKVAHLAIVSGTASYALPADFSKLIRLTSLATPDGVLVTDVLIPVPRSTSERHTIANFTITFHPTPAYTMDRALWYAATYALDGDDYTDLTDDLAQIAMLKARAICLAHQASRAAPLSMRIKSGDDDADRTKVAATLREIAQSWQDQYDAAVKRLNGPTGMRG